MCACACAQANDSICLCTQLTCMHVCAHARVCVSRAPNSHLQWIIEVPKRGSVFVCRGGVAAAGGYLTVCLQKNTQPVPRGGHQGSVARHLLRCSSRCTQSWWLQSRASVTTKWFIHKRLLSLCCRSPNVWRLSPKVGESHFFSSQHDATFINPFQVVEKPDWDQELAKWLLLGGFWTDGRRDGGCRQRVKARPQVDKTLSNTIGSADNPAGRQ